MLKLQTDLNLIDRFDVTASTTVIATSGLQGRWAVPTANGWDFPVTAGAHPAYLIWTEGNYDGTTETAGFTPDATDTAKLTFLAGKYRIKTNQHTGTITLNTPLYVNASGVLEDCIISSIESGVVAHCIATADSDGYITIQTV